MDVKARSESFQEMMRASEQASGKLEGALRSAGSSEKQVAAALEQVTKHCTSCHRQFRDVPLQDKKEP